MRPTKRTVDQCKAAAKEYQIWDDDVTGFGLRVYPSGRKSYFVQYRVGRQTRKLSLGAAGHLTPEEARKLAQLKLGQVAKGEDPSAAKRKGMAEPTVANLCERFFE